MWSTSGLNAIVAGIANDLPGEASAVLQVMAPLLLVLVAVGLARIALSLWRSLF